MITDALLNFWFGLVDWFAGILPQSDGSLGVVDSLDFLFDLDYFLPIHEVMAAVAVVLAMGPPMAVAQAAIWAYHQVWGSD